MYVISLSLSLYIYIYIFMYSIISNILRWMGMRPNSVTKTVYKFDASWMDMEKAKRTNGPNADRNRPCGEGHGANQHWNG